ncbi:MAG: family 16 glycoside hydrolase, partial [Planctomycetota bacterium]
MPAIRSLPFLLAAVLLVGAAAGRGAAQSPDDALAATLSAAADARVAAMAANDVAALGAILSDELRYVHSSGTADTKAEFIANLTSGTIRYVEYLQGDRTWRVPAPGVALESGRATVKVAGPSGTMRHHLSYLATWRVEDGRWRFVAWQSARIPQPALPAGFTPLFDGESLAGWRGRPHLDPAAEAAMTPEERGAKQAEWDEDMRAHWKVEGGEIESDGHGVVLTTDRDYGDFELHLEWMLPEPCADSGIYLRGNPQVQIWDPSCERDFKHGCQKGSGGLWNSPAGSEGKDPLVKADRPIGEWNAMKIRMQGDRVTVVLNDQLVVDHQPLPNYFTKGMAALPDRGPIQIQTHGAPMHVRNVFIRELGTLDGSGPGWRDLGEADFENVNCAADTWAWKNGTARCTGAPIGVIRTKKPVTNFELSAEWRHLTA